MVQGFGYFAIELDRLALLTRDLPCIPTIGVDLQDFTTIALKPCIGCIDLIV